MEKVASVAIAIVLLVVCVPLAIDHLSKFNVVSIKDRIPDMCLSRRYCEYRKCYVPVPK